ncbi:signal peptidase I [Ectobacillus antri]|jgi:signal peptidase|uniref:Signal peptidase I n=1 Tax=Ectobacillus antri TaxID=2486280 RepID=A0ABT6H4U6_9BACI|nr:signal peptidase I [Ectobacillus antri]MDG4657500.1 signal peptidase I [Ectobacillus antri]MDG5753813.1 signal peptidase I [Ectobacillus antri]
MKRAISLISRVITIVMFSCMLLFAYLAISSKFTGGKPNVFGYEIKTVLSGSMEPAFYTGSIIAIKPVQSGTTYKPGDVITYKLQDGTLVTHRVKEVNAAGEEVMYVTKGDANDAADSEPVSHKNVVGSYTGFTIPYVGYAADYARSKTGSALLLIVPGILLLFYAAISIFDALRQIDNKEPADLSQ